MPPTRPAHDARVGSRQGVDLGPGADAAGDRLADKLIHHPAATALEGARRLAALPGAAWTRLRLPTGRRDEAGAGRPMRRHARVLMRALRQRLVAGNRFELLIDGPDTYAAMFRAIDGARDHINLESYIVEADGPGEELAQRLLAKVREGVKVNLLFDGFGSITTAARYFDTLREGGVQVCEYNPIRFWRLPWRSASAPSGGRTERSWRTLFSRAVHLRDHRKLLVVDGRVAFLGGVNISGVYSAGSSAEMPARQGASADATPPWRDTHVRLTGPLVADLQKLFVAHWNKHARHAIQPAHYLPPLAHVGPQRAAVASFEAGRRRNPFYRALLRAIDAAQDRVLLTTAYFVPTRRLLRALGAAARRGVDVRIVLPSQSDAWAPLHAGRSHYGRLLQAGVRVFERQGALLHAKTTVIDGVWAAVGSSNLDWRSFFHNAEANAIVLDAGFGAEMEAVFDSDVAASREVTIEEWRRRGWIRRLQEALARRFEFLL